MLESRVSRPSLLHLLLLILSFCGVTASLKVTSTSPCQPVCADPFVDTTADDIVCLDSAYASTTNGSHFKRCVECELGSTTVDPSNGATDVNWALYNLRYAFSTCIFGFPIEKISVSTPCQISCDPMQDALGDKLKVNTTKEDLSFCSLPSFQDSATINRCAECYGRMENQAYLANFVQALHIACLDPPRPSEAFPVAAESIFDSNPIPTPTPSPTGQPTPGKSPNLALVIALPVVFGVLVIGGVAVCCFYSARRRRRIMAERNNMRAIHDKSSPTHPSSQQQYYQSNQLQSPTSAFEQTAYFSHLSDQKDNPYPPVAVPAPAQPFHREQPSSTQHLPPESSQGPYYRPYSPAEYATQLDPHKPMETSQAEAGSDQSQVHDQYFPLPPPPSHLPPPASSSKPISIPPPPPPQSQEGVESLTQHHRNTPSLILPVPKKKKSLASQRSQQGAEQQPRQQPGDQSGSQAEAIPLQECEAGRAVDTAGHNTNGDETKGYNAVGEEPRPRKQQQQQQEREGKEQEVDEKPSNIPSQVFVYDPGHGRYVKQGQ